MTRARASSKVEVAASFRTIWETRGAGAARPLPGVAPSGLAPDRCVTTGAALFDRPAPLLAGTAESGGGTMTDGCSLIRSGTKEPRATKEEDPASEEP